jgi:hypothetical protein
VAPGVLLAGFVSVTAMVLRYSPKMTFLFDEWRFIEYRHGSPARSLFAPYEGNLLALHVALYRVLWSVVGLKDYVPYQLTALGLHLIVVLLLYRYAKRRVGDVPALVVALIFLTLGRATGQFVTLDAANHTLNMLSLCATLLFLDHNTRRGDRLAAASLAIGLLSYGYALVFVVAIIAELLLRREPRRLLPFAVPVGLYAAWYIGKGALAIEPALLHQRGGDALAAMGRSPLRLSSIGLVPSYFARVAMYAGGALIGQGSALGLVVLAGFVIAIALHLRARRLSPRAVMLMLSILGSWVVVSFARAAFEPLISPNAARFVYTGSFMLLLLAVELAKGLSFERWQLAAVGLVLVTALAGNVPQIRTQSKLFNAIATDARGQVVALQLAAPRVPPEAGTTSGALNLVREGPLQRAYAHLGSHPPFDDLTTASGGERAATDRLLVSLYGVTLADPGPGPPSGCRESTSAPAGEPLVVALPIGGLRIRAHGDGVRVAISRFSDAPGIVLGTIAPQQLRTLTGTGEEGWRALFESSGPFDICTAG